VAFREAGMPGLKPVRSFIAVDLPGSLRARLADVSRQLSASIPRGAVRWMRPEGIHLTLKFLGDVTPAQLPAIQGLLAEIARHAQPCTCTVCGLGSFPDPRRPRVLWVGVHEASGSLKDLQQGLESGLAELGFPLEGRAFNPHLTLGRVRPERASAAAQIHAAIEAAGEIDLGSLEAGSICLFRSDLRPEGATYTRLGEFALGGIS
jgi:2'-5' RNA ligase